MIKVPTVFALQNANLTWRDWRWGFSHGLVSRNDLVNMAGAMLVKIDEDDALFKLASVMDESEEFIIDILRELEIKYPNEQSHPEKDKWLFLILYWIFENREQYEDPLSEVEDVYAEFGYPEQISSFVRYMPVKDNYDPKVHSLEENINRLIKNWESFLLECKAQYLTKMN